MGRFFNRDTTSSGSHAQDAADYAAAQDQRELQSNRDDANTRGKTQPADGQYIDRGTRWGGWS